MKRLLAVALLLGATSFSVTGCKTADGQPAPIEGGSAVIGGVGGLVVEALPPGFHSVGALALNALIQLSESNGWTREQFLVAVAEADLAAHGVPGQPRTAAVTADAEAKAMIAAHLADLKARGR